MARIDCTFSMRVAPEQAQTQFVSDIAPELAGKAELALCREEPGRLEFAFIETPGMVIARHTPLYPRRMLAGPNINVEFEPDPLGTKVVIRGHCERAVCVALELLGSPGHWPATAGEPHD